VFGGDGDDERDPTVHLPAVPAPKRLESGPVAEARNGQVLQGVYPPSSAPGFDRKTGQSSQLREDFLHWADPAQMRTQVREKLAVASADGARPVFNIGLDPITASRAVEAISPGEIASGAGDRELAEISEAVNELGRPVWMRPMAEMNGGFNVYSHADMNGVERGPDHDYEDFRQAFRRMTVIMRGGSTHAINSKLDELGMPPLDARVGDLPSSGEVGIIWNPHGESSPNNVTEEFYPGDEYCDMVGGDIYASGDDSRYWDGFEQIYESHPDKPFVIGEWGVDSNAEDPEFVRRVYDWAGSHDRVIGMVWYDGVDGEGYAISEKPETQQAYHDGLAQLPGKG